MNKRNKIIYWIATIWLSLGMLSTGAVQLFRVSGEGPGSVDSMAHLGYPVYFVTILGIYKILGVVALLIPKFPLLKEWAYASFVFVMSGAVFSHFAVGDEAKEFFGPSLLIVLTVISWYFRPANRKVTLVNQ